LIWDDFAVNPFATKNIAPTKEDLQHVTNCKVNIISELPQETRYGWRRGKAAFTVNSSWKLKRKIAGLGLGGYG
jgi:hypothetical protein